MANPEKAGARTLAGQCFCSLVRYEVTDEFAYAVNCHCSNCRRTTGSAFKPIAGIARDKFHLTAGDDRLLIYGDAGGHDAHCGQCGSLLYSLVREGAYVHVAMGTLTGDPSIRPSAHIFVGSRRHGSRLRTTCRNIVNMSPADGRNFRRQNFVLRHPWSQACRSYC